MKRLFVALMLCLVSIVGFGQNPIPEEPYVITNSGLIPTVKIGNQGWMSQCLNVQIDTSGNVLRQGQTGLMTSGGGNYINQANWYYQNYDYLTNQNNDKYYNITTAKHICPRGWKLPTQNDFIQLQQNIITDTSLYNWHANEWVKALCDTSINGTNTTNFNAKNNGLFYAPRPSDGYWRLSQYYNENPCYATETGVIIIEPTNNNIIYTSLTKQYAQVRCIKDTTYRLQLIEYDTITEIDTILVPDTIYIHDTVYIHDTIYITDTVFITADNDTIPVGAPEDLPDDSHTEHSLVYPNPTYDGQFSLLYVDYDTPIRLYSPTGVLIKETTRNGYGCCIPFVELADPRYSNGSYIIEYWYQGRRHAEFIIVIK